MNPINKIIWGAVAAVALAVAVAIVWLLLSNAHLKTTVAQAQAEAAICRVANDEFAAKATLQNAAIAALKTESDTRAARAAQAEAAAQETAQSYLTNAAKFAARKPVGDDCKAANDLINAYIGGKP